MGPNPPDLTPYQQLLDSLLRYDTSEQVAEHIAASYGLLDRTLLQVLASRPALTEAAAREQQWLQQVLAPMLSRKWLYEYLNLPSEEFSFAMAHPELLTQAVYAEVEHLLKEYARDTVNHQHLANRQATIAQAAVVQLVVYWQWPVARLIFLNGLSWLTHPIVAQYLTVAPQKRPELAERAALVAEIIARCQVEGPGPFVREIDLGELLDKIDKTSGDKHLSLIREALVLVRPDQTALWAFLQLKLGNALYSTRSGNRAQNIDQTIHCYQQALLFYTLEHHSEDWATIQHNVATAYVNRLRGEQADNIEQALYYYSQALLVHTREQHPQEWARDQDGLGISFFNRLLGGRADNIEQAINAFHQALLVRTREQHLHEWAETQNNLGAAYAEQLRGERAQNIEQAINCFEQALTAYTLEHNARDWAMTHLSLGNAYTLRLLGERAQNIELAIRYYDQTLAVCTREQYPEQWAMAQLNLGNAYYDRLLGERAQNIEQAIHQYKQALLVYTHETYVRQWATIQNNLGNAYRVRLRGTRAQNIEQAIYCFDQALQVRTREQDAEAWAATHCGLGGAYGTRLQGEGAQNIEDAIACFQAALAVYTREHYPEDWARTQDHLGVAYSTRLRGDRAQNIEDAIAYFQAALSVRTHEHYAEDWATTQNNLGGACRARLRGDRAQNIEDAIACFQAALAVRTREHYAKAWASTQYGLGIAYHNRLQGERAQNLEDAIACFQAALAVRTREHYAEDWASTQHGLGSTYTDRLRGDRAQNIEDAIACFQAALAVRTREHYAEDWASTQHSLGIAYGDRLQGKRAQNAEDAIACFRAALSVRTREQDAEDWASTQHGLGGAYTDRLWGDRTQNIEDAIVCFQAALQIHTRERDAKTWAATQNNLGGAYRVRLRGEHAQNVEDAIACLQAALQVYTREQYPQTCRDTYVNLGHVFYLEKRWREAQAAYQEAHEALVLLRAQTEREESRRQLAQQNAQLYLHLIHCCLELHDGEAAATYALAGKSRSLTELLIGAPQSLDQLLAQNPALATEWEPIQQFQAELDKLLATLSRSTYEDDSRPAGERQVTATQLAQVAALRQTINQHTDTLLFRYPALAAVQPLPPLTHGQMQDLSEELGQVPLVEYVRHGGGWGAFVILSNVTYYVALAANLINLLSKDITAILNDTFWHQSLADQTQALTRLHALLIAPLREYLPPSGELVLAPTQQLHAVPFQALLSAQGRYLAEDYALSFVPSLATIYVLYEQRRQTQSADATTAHRLLSVAHSGQGRAYLANVLPEADAVREHFTEAVQLLEADARPERVFEAARQPFSVMHINCHARFDVDAPLNSALLLAGDQLLTVNDIRLRLRLLGHPLVALSACQTGQIRPEQGDEANGLSWAFLAAGAAAVVSSQWSVPDQATRELFEAFYHQRRQAPVSEAEALRRAIAQLRQAGAYRNRPFFWAAFQVMGLPTAR